MNHEVFHLRDFTHNNITANDIAVAFGLSTECLCNMSSYLLGKSKEEGASFALNLLKNKDLRTFDNGKSVCRSVELRIEGNAAFQRKDYNSALILYTQSAAYAPLPSDETAGEAEPEALTALSLAIGNRSAVLFALGKYESCLKNIDYALEMNYPAELSQKIYARKEKCLKALEKCQTSKQPSLSDSVAEDVDKDRDFVDTQISYGMNAHLPSCSDCVELKTTHDMGRGLFATKDIKIGDVIIIEEPFVAVLKEQYLYSFCHNCCKRCNFLIPCQHCTVAMFCSVECRKSSWELYHSVECTVLPSLLQNKLYDRAAYPLRTIIVASKKFKSLDDFYKTVKSWGGNDVQKDLKKCSDYFQVHNLVTRIADLHQMLIIYLGGAFVTLLLERKTNFFATAEKSKNIKGVPTGKLKVFITSLFVKHALCQPSGILTVDLMRNSMGIGIRLTSIGYATYPTRSLLNHSCDPNVICYTDFDNYTVVRALRIIKKGEQIFESYGPQHSHHDLQERRAWLLQGHGFTCQCVACQEDWPLMENLAKVMVRFKCKSCGSKLPEKISRILKCTRCHTVNDTHRLFGGILAGIRTMERVTPHVAKNGLHTMNILYFMKNTMSYVVRPSHALLYCEEYLTDYYLERVALKNVD